jgi:eukaryotic-like serine/threonine-protein kinase
MAEDAFGIVGSVIASAYHVESVVAEGGFGTVYRAHHGGFRAPVALKCLRLPPGLLTEDRTHFLEAFRAEAELLFLLSASIPTVVRPLHVDAFTLPDGRFVPYIVLEWLEGSTLDALIRKRARDNQAPLGLKKVVRLLTPVARALERAHNFRGAAGPVSIVHRDIKPENIFVADVAGEETVKILDFGIGKAKSMVSQVAGRASQSAGGIATFTPAYGSPEQWAPKLYGQTGPWTDVWGLALTVTEALVGHPVIEGDPAAIMGTVLDAHRRPTPGSEGVIVSDEVERVMEKAMAVDPRFRYADAGVFWNALLAAARITSGEVQAVRVPRDARAEPGGGTWVERVDVQRRASSHPAGSSAPAPPLSSSMPPVSRGIVSSPRPEAPLAGSSRPSPPTGGATAPLLRPLAPSPGPLHPALSGSFEVPDLDLAPVSRPAPMPRTSSGMRPAIAPPIDLDIAAEEASLSPPLDLDLPSNDPLVRRVSSGGMRAVRPPSDPAPGFRALQTPLSSDPFERSMSPPPAALSPSPARSPLPQQAAPSAHRAGDRLAAIGGLGARMARQTLAQRLLPGGAVVAAAIVVTILDQVYTAISGDIFTFLSLRTSVIAGLLMVLGFGMCAYRLKRD